MKNNYYLIPEQIKDEMKTDINYKFALKRQENIFKSK